LETNLPKQGENKVQRHAKALWQEIGAAVISLNPANDWVYKLNYKLERFL